MSERISKGISRRDAQDSYSKHVFSPLLLTMHMPLTDL